MVLSFLSPPSIYIIVRLSDIPIPGANPGIGRGEAHRFEQSRCASFSLFRILNKDFFFFSLIKGIAENAWILVGKGG
jgi:hypothetical protein